MKKIFAVILIVIFSSLTLIAQSTLDANWKTLAPSNDIFSVETPDALNFNQFDKDKPNGVYDGLTNATYFFVVSNELKDSSQNRIVLNFVNSFRQSGKTGKFEDFDFEKFELADDDGFYHNVLILQNKTRIYVFQTTSPMPTNPAIERFFSSIKLNGKSLSETTVSSDAKKTDAKANLTTENQSTTTKNSDVTGNVSKSGQGSGIGTGDGRGITNPTSTSTPTTNTNINQAVKITLTIKALYTDLARFYNIQGTIPMRVIFNANGTIGSVTPVTKLPFGLTAQAIAAAKQIRFEPAIKNSVPYTVIKLVVYSFTIY